jgi:hypothetical protein
MAASTQHGHRWSLHKVGETPASGFGYPSASKNPTRADVEAQAADWNARAKATCTLNHPACAACQLCGITYTVTDLEERNGS